ncbi:DUF5985 family protein [Sphingomonas psychrotolerans]|uniref:Uncharacterized protein n=1 Tax=Sphingomonas psychrotolerans TaxID=1327635 RepID=A0A2K8MDA8_9SPHN|nr:DUF5985 family protein [Sphingomonas psychrotolerans]ATY31853.1 hypothetical protein CVN68_07620 [Sphingomonas psychrotolerans]
MTLLAFLSGAVTLGFATAALFFLRFWRDTRDELFLAFAATFLMLGVAQAILALGGIPDEQRSWVYLVRLVAFLTIIVAILRKNRAR